MSLGFFSEEDAKIIARAIRQLNSTARGNKQRHRRRARSGSGGSFEECSGGGILIPGLAESPIVDAQDADYVIGIRDGCLVLIEIGVCTNDDPITSSTSAPPPE